MTGSASRRRFRDYLVEAASRRQRSATDRTHITRHGTEVSSRRSRTIGALLGAFWRFLRRDRPSLAAALGCATVSAALELLPPAATKIAIDNVFSGDPLSAGVRGIAPASWTFIDDPSGLLATLAVAIIVVSFVAVAFGTYGRLLATRNVKRLQNRVRRFVFTHALRLPLSRIHQMRTGGFVATLREDAGGVGDLVFSMLYNPWRAAIQLTGSLAILAVTDWRLLVGALVLLPMVALSHRTWIGRIRPIYRDIKHSRDGIDAHATEVFGGMRVVRGFARTRTECVRYAQGSHMMARQELLAWWWSRGIDLAWALFIPVASAALLWYGGSQVLAGTLKPGDLVLFLTYVLMLLVPIQVLASSATAFQANLAGLDRILDLLNEPEEMPDRQGAVRIVKREILGEIEARGVAYRYPGSNEDALHGISFCARAGQSIALVGPSGGGKTTLCNLVARFFDPTAGSITVDGRDLRDVTLDSWRRSLGIVEQDIFLFDGTILDNIRYADRTADHARVVAAADLANAAEFIVRLPEGYSTRIGERGVRLSGGQRQRLAIARALLADPRILILDEATSSLDSESELLIRQAIASLVEDRTTFVIAHRLSTIQHADLILVIEQGRITAAGSHQELMAASEKYQQMVLMQTADPSAWKRLRSGDAPQGRTAPALE
ncbi:MAG: ABC transporter ATP-binding protein [Phycisphaerales bacterium]|nr:ABC transporter ATP-binding protein [Phycisphaerales bacterium]